MASAQVSVDVSQRRIICFNRRVDKVSSQKIMNAYQQARIIYFRNPHRLVFKLANHPVYKFRWGSPGLKRAHKKKVKPISSHPQLTYPQLAREGF
jgi:hypothetical protein